MGFIFKPLSYLFVLFLLCPLFVQAQLLNNPQKIVIDEARDRLLVSNYGNGALVEIDAEGNQDYFAQNAGFIDGMDIVGDTIYGVGSNRRLIAYDLETAQQIMNIPLLGSAAHYLSSIASDSNGHLFISCPPLHTIYRFRISDQSYWIFAQGNGLNRPNGIQLELDNDRIVVIDDSPGTSMIHAISLTDSTVSDLTTTQLDRPDGIVRDIYGYYYIGGYYLPGLYRVDPDFSQEPEMIFAGSHMVYPTYDESDHSLLITYYLANDWARVMLGTGSEEQSLLPTNLESFRSYPNPFLLSPTGRSRGTTISFSLTRPSKVEIDIFNIRGQIINNLIELEYATGDHEIIWNGTDDYGQNVGSGLYFCNMKINGITVDSRKMLLLE